MPRDLKKNMRNDIYLPELMLGKNRLLSLFHEQRCCILKLICHVAGMQKSERPSSRLLSEKEAIGQDAENKSSEEGLFPIALRRCKVEHGGQNPYIRGEHDHSNA
jgi:hypothetical protein